MIATEGPFRNLNETVAKVSSGVRFRSIMSGRDGSGRNLALLEVVAAIGIEIAGVFESKEVPNATKS
jgi:hypothetical protein